jgi:valyl-tRNA synthetase
MVMAGCEFMGDIPFHTVYLHGTVRDTQHRKMSKSLGNGIDPIEVVEKFGADALRYTVIAGMSVGTDVILDPEDLETSFAPGRNFANKVWNAGRFILTNLGEAPTRPLAGAHRDVLRPEELGLADRWIIARCDAMVRDATASYERFRLNEAASAVYRFVWSDLADWYLEQAKPRLYGSEPGGDVARAVIGRTFEVALAVLHPIMPFVTETLWRRFPNRPDHGTLVRAPWPRPDRRAVDADAEREFALVQELVGAIRQIRAEYGVEPGRTVSVRVSHAHGAFRQEESCIRRLAKLGALSYGPPLAEPGANAVLSDGTALYIALGELVDVVKECERLGAESARLAQLLDGQRKKLGNEQFVSRAPVNVVRHEREKLASLEQQLLVLRQKREQLGCR